MKDDQTANQETEDRLCVPFSEALWWIACRNLAGPCIGPQRLSVRRRRGRSDDQDFRDVMEDRRDLAAEILLDRAAHRKIRIYSWQPRCVLLNKSRIVAEYGQSDRVNQLDTVWEFDYLLVNTKQLQTANWSEEDGEDRLYWLNDDEEESEAITDLVVDYQDLIDQFWGKEAEATDSAEMRSSHRRRAKGAGPPTKYDWPSFVFEAMRRCQTGSIRQQSDLERAMTDWCANNWPDEPAISAVRWWAGSVFKEFRRVGAILSEAGPSDTKNSG